MRFVLVLLVGLVLAGTATAAPPEGFRYSYPLSKRAVKISGQPGARIYCAPTRAVFDAFAVEQIGRSNVDGLTSTPTRETAFPPYVCRTLEAFLRGVNVSNRSLAVAMLGLVHESMHLRGIVSEGVAECRALKLLPSVARYRFEIRSAARRAALLKWARLYSFC